MQPAEKIDAFNTGFEEDYIFRELRACGVEIRGDIMSPVVPYEDYTFDENNICPKAWAKRKAASKRKQRKSN